MPELTALSLIFPAFIGTLTAAAAWFAHYRRVSRSFLGLWMLCVTGAALGYHWAMFDQARGTLLPWAAAGALFLLLLFELMGDARL